MRHIGARDLIGNVAIILLAEAGKREVSIDKIIEFSEKAKEYLKNEGIDSSFSIEEDEIKDFIKNYSDWFEFDDKEKLIRIDKAVLAEDLMYEFVVELELFAAFRNQKTRAVLL